ncbi:hypothetical protein THAOC_04184 [Thalassiosira oceanica]|uniref:Uncharacterized protein n=1 Tax=Thalassiosira oceanica TaxID=159749 RepID=K0TJS8_THAOC|nr:hypothetical protein THAOC_04184 [Thalassiosira oceanica]|eukprot:EJK74156.1 hypothetical protein THAOC_04184 [Thalassiosira oceanica]
MGDLDPCRCPPSGPSGKSGKTKGRNLEGEDQDRELWGAPGCSCGDDDWAPPGWGSDDDYYYGGKGGKSGSKGGKSGGYDDDDYSPWSPPGLGGPYPCDCGDDDYSYGKSGKTKGRKLEAEDSEVAEGSERELWGSPGCYCGPSYPPVYGGWSSPYYPSGGKGGKTKGY